MKTQFEKLAEQCLEGVTRVEDAQLALAEGFRALVTKLVNEGIITLEDEGPAIELTEEELRSELDKPSWTHQDEE